MSAAVVWCPECGGGASRYIYAGLPFSLCDTEDCATGWGIGSWVGLVWFNGEMWRYEGMGYWRALWNWLWNREVQP